MNSVTEGSSRGVPMVCIPLFSEQSRNANLLKYRGTAVVVEKKDLMNGKVLEAAINEILINDNPKVGRSRIGFYGKLADILVDAGHDVTVYEPTIEVNLSSKGIGSKKAKMVERPCDFEVLFNSDEAQGDVWSIEPLGLFAFQKFVYYNEELVTNSNAIISKTTTIQNMS
uniref:glucuronosyltransferase n=1 Tax=Acrobeloides nanus TaxID=290746 RepID=A0A914E817_9BILA